MIKWKKKLLFASHALRRERIAFEEFEDGIWSVYYGPVLLARFDERKGEFYG